MVREPQYHACGERYSVEIRNGPGVFALHARADSLATSCSVARSAVTASCVRHPGKMSPTSVCQDSCTVPFELVLTPVPSSISWLIARAVNSFELDAIENSVWRQVS